MNKYTFNIRQNINGNIKSQNVSVKANSEKEAEKMVKADFNNVVDAVLLWVEEYDCIF